MNKKIALAILVLVFITMVFVFLRGRAPSSLAVQDEEKSNEEDVVDWEWVKDNCECVERERLYCGYEGFELINKTCWRGKEFTNPLEACSKYNCTGEIYSYSGE